MFFKFLICFLASIGAGVGTGLAGMSAAVIISPMLITFLGMDAYSAIGIALASDVLASAVSAYTYGKNKKIDIKNSWLMLVVVLAFTVLFSWISSLVHHDTLELFSVVGTIIIAIKFLIKPDLNTKTTLSNDNPTKGTILVIICGAIVGSICGFAGAGGGMMMLILLTTVLGYELKTAVGTSVFIMTFTALVGSVSHFVVDGAPDWFCLIICMVFTLVFARISALIANKVSPKTLNLTLGITLLALSIVIIIFNCI